MRRYTIEIAGHTYTIDVQELAADRFRAQVGDESFEVRLAADEDLAEAVITPEIVHNGAHLVAPTYRPAAPTPPVASPAATLPPVPAPSRPATNGHRGGELTAPLPGVVVSVAVVSGARVEQGQELLVLEAMKMKNTIRASHAGVVADVLVQPGQAVRHDDVLLRIQQS
jgi:biotin carboxyl carrier protein